MTNTELVNELADFVVKTIKDEYVSDERLRVASYIAVSLLQDCILESAETR